MNPKINKNQLVINWHILENCNFSCGYCYAHWPQMRRPEAWRSPELTSRILEELSHMPSLVPGEWVGPPRLNFAGGEPMLLYKNGELPRVMSEAEQLGFTLSIITNGYLLTDEIVGQLAPRVNILGISIDSADPETNQKIGRSRKRDASKQISVERVAAIFRLAREVNPNIECKLNTVVCTYNWEENFHSMLDKIAPDRWKVFQMLPIADTEEVADKQQPFIIKDSEFKDFVSRHESLDIMRPENNDEMTHSYVMVDPFGRFYQNDPVGEGEFHRHTVSDPIHEVGVRKAWSQVRFDTDKFVWRYPGQSR
ncbi:MAG: viperin family antiviral radical SAM protein [Hormoscilla sp.]